MRTVLAAACAIAILAPVALAADPSARLDGTLFLYPDVSYETRSGGKIDDLPRRPLTFAAGCEGAGPCENVLLEGRVPTLRSHRIKLKRRECYPGVGGITHDGQSCYVGSETTSYTGRCTVKRRRNGRVYRRKVTRHGKGTRLIQIAGGGGGQYGKVDPSDEDWSGASDLYMYFIAPSRPEDRSSPFPGAPPFLQPEGDPIPGHPAPKWLTSRSCRVSPALTLPYKPYRGHSVDGMDAELKPE